MKRRNILRAVGSSAAIGLAGCTGDNNTPTPEGGNGGDGGDGGDGSSGGSGGTPAGTATPSFEERMKLNPEQYEYQTPFCSTEHLSYIVKMVSDTQFVTMLEGFYKTEQKCVRTRFLSPKYDHDAGNVTIRVGAGKKFDGECKSECEDEVPTIRFTERVEILFNDTASDALNLDTFSVVFVYPDGSTSKVAEDIPLKQGETNTD